MVSVCLEMVCDAVPYLVQQDPLVCNGRCLWRDRDSGPDMDLVVDEVGSLLFVVVGDDPKAAGRL